MGSIDPCFSCTDRVAVIDMQSGKARSMTKRELDFMSREQLQRG
jgi:hypothetical protein